MQTKKSSLNWTNTIFFTLLPIIAIVGTVLLCVFHITHWPTWILMGVYTALTGLAITAGYHRLFSHKCYQATWPVRLFFILLGAAAFEGSVLEWCTDHRNHHRYTDTDKDPYSVKKGFWHAHIGWLFKLDTEARNFDNVEDLQNDPLVRWQHKYYLIIAITTGFILPMAIAALWGDPWSGLIIAGALRLTFNHHATFAVNSVCHYFGKRTYSNNQSARDNWLTALLTYGEGFHNFHHQFPLDYRNGIRAYHYDPAKWLIRFLSWLGLVHSLKRVSDHRIIRYRLQVEEQWLLQKLTQAQGLALTHLNKIAQPIRENIQQLLTRLEALEKEYTVLRKQKLEKVCTKMSEYRQQLKAYRFSVKATQQELKAHLLVWTELLSSCKRFVAVR